MGSILVSVVVPVYSGAAYLRKLVGEMDAVRQDWQSTPMQLVECIFVDDASVDHSSLVLEELCREYPWARHITLSRNFGQHHATAAGLLHTCGDWVFTIDEDLQHPPHLFSSLLKKAVLERHDLVYVCPKKGAHQSFFRDFSSKFFKSAMAWLTENPQMRKFNSFRLIRGSIARAAASVYRSDGYLDVIFGWFTQSIGGIEVPLHDERYKQLKRSGYSFMKLLSHARRLIVSSHLKILRLGFALGVMSMALSLIFGVYLLYLKWTAAFDVRGWTSLMLTTLFFGGSILFILGFILEYFMVVLNQTSGKPSFFIVNREKDELLRTHFSMLHDIALQTR